MTSMGIHLPPAVISRFRQAVRLQVGLTLVCHLLAKWYYVRKELAFVNADHFMPHRHLFDVTEMSCACGSHLLAARPEW